MTVKMEKKAELKTAWQRTVNDALHEHRQKTLADFAKDTTFHGVKYIFDGSYSSPYRRFLWLACWIGAIALFTYQVTSRIIEYRKHPTNVDVKIIYNDTVDFPAVTICNQNQFRFRAAADMDIYYLLDAVYNTSDPRSVDFTQFAYPKTESLDTILRQLAHRKLDFIANCKWDYATCDIDSSFAMQATDMGYCFTFNLVNGHLHVRQPGIRAGLRLVVNVEQYEYMKGPHSDAGVKVYLHDQKEFPMVTDMGFSVAPGTHTVASAKLVEVRSIEPPYGTCQQGAQLMTNCRLECLTRQAAIKCGCRDVYMPAMNVSVDLCDIENKLVCLHELTNQVQNSDICTCAQSCNRRRFDVSLSNAQLSRFNVDRAVLRDNMHYIKVQDDFHSSMEKAERYIKKKWALNKKIMKDAQNRYNEVMTMLRYGNEIMANSNLYAAQLQTMDMTTTGNALIENDISYIKNKVKYLEDVSKELEKDDTQWHEIEDEVKEMFGHMGGQPFGSLQAFSSALQKCISDEVGLPLPPKIEPGNYFFSPDCQPFNEKISDIKEECGDMYHGGEAFIKKYDTWKAMLNTTVEDLFKDTVKVPDSRHYECMQKLTTVAERWTSVVSLMVSAGAEFDNPNTTDDAAEVLSLTNNLIAINQTDGMWLGEINKDVSSCEWLSRVVREESHDYKDISSFHTDGLTTLRELYTQIIEGYNDTFRLINNTLEPTMSLLEEFFLEKVTKLDLTEPFLQVQFREGWTSLYSEANSLEKLALSLEERLKEVAEEFAKNLKKLSSAPVPVVDDLEIQSLTLIEYIHNQSYSEMDTHMANIAVPGLAAESLKHIMISLIKDFYTTVIGQTKSFVETARDASSKVNLLLDDLEDYKDAADMNQDFYMQNFLMLDIYYSELTYETVTQQKAFEFLSLLSEIGGFLGLLLGASILTVCEVLDYIISQVLACMRRKRAVNDDKSDMITHPVQYIDQS